METDKDQKEQEIATSPIYGNVYEIHPETQTLGLWISGFDEIQQVDIVPSMPPWLFKLGKAFDTKIMRAQRKKRHIERGFDGWGPFIENPDCDIDWGMAMMKSQQELCEEECAAIRQEDVVAYLEEQGWTLQPDTHNIELIYTKPDGYGDRFILALPINERNKQRCRSCFEDAFERLGQIEGIWWPRLVLKFQDIAREREG